MTTKRVTMEKSTTISNEKTLIVIAGPTASGKTALAIKLAKEFDTEIVSADSRQFYREMTIGTAKPSPDELQAVKHHFIGHISIFDKYDISRFETDAMQVITQLFLSHNIVILCGGSGLYIDAVVKGVDELPDVDMEVRNHLKQMLELKGLDYLLSVLRDIDPEYYDVVDKKNPIRIIRAIEVFQTTGQKFSMLRKGVDKHRDFAIQKFVIATNREMLNEKISRRVDQMISAGLVEEAKQLFLHQHLNALQTVGYRELFDCFEGRLSLSEAIEKIKTNTRRYAKKQITWLKRDASYRWLPAEQIVAELREAYGK